MSRYFHKILNWVLRNGDKKPSESISDARWRAMYTACRRVLDQGNHDDL